MDFQIKNSGVLSGVPPLSNIAMGNILPRNSGDSLSLSTNSIGIDPAVSERLDRIRYYFASRTSAYDDIWNVCYRLSEEIHEQVLDVFILTLIDHWDKELERYVLLFERCLILLDFDFERLETRQLFIYDYSRFNSIRIGPLCYPSTAFNYFQTHRSKYAIRFQWDSQKPLNYRDYWNPWSKEIPWLTLTEHPLASYIEDILDITSHDPMEESHTFIHDQYFSREYFQQIRRRFSIETFHDKLMEMLNSFQPVPRNQFPRLDIRDSSCSNRIHPLEYAVQNNILIELHHPSSSNEGHQRQQVTIVHYSPILLESYFNLPAALFNRSNLGYYRLRLF